VTHRRGGKILKPRRKGGNLGTGKRKVGQGERPFKSLGEGNRISTTKGIEGNTPRVETVLQAMRRTTT